MNERDNTWRIVNRTETAIVEERWGPVTDHTSPGEKFPDGWYTGQEFRIQIAEEEVETA